MSIVRTVLPGDLARARATVRDAREDEEQIGEAIQVDDDELRDVDLAAQMHDASFGAPTDRASDVEGRGLRRPARNDERLERLELLLAVVDRALELCDALVVDARLLELLAHLVRMRCRQQRADGEQVALNRDE